MNTSLVLLGALAGYLAGSISFSQLISKLVAPDKDVQDVDIPISGTDRTYRMNARGATTISLVLGPKVGCTIGLLDMAKVALPALIFRLLFPTQPYFLVVAAMGMVGHNWPVYYRFKGGRGISAAYGGMFVVDWLGAVATSSVGMMLGIVVFRDFLVSYLAGLWLMIPWFWFRTDDWRYVAYAVAINLLFMVAMIPDIKQVLELRREAGGKGDMKSMMETTPMGRGMLKMMERLSFFRR